MENARPLEGVKVVELSTFVAAACSTRFFADQGAEVIKIEPLGGDNLRYAAKTDGITDDPFENLTFDIENANKKSVSMNLKDPECYEALMKLIGQSDMFVTNWRPQALQKMHLDYESLKEKFPALVYGTVTGYGEVGPDKDLPGYDGTAFFTRSGILGSTYERETVPINLIPSMGDRPTGMALAAGLLAALYKAKLTGKGDKVSISLLSMAIFMQATLLQASQYGTVNYPIRKEETLNPLMSSYKTKDDRFIQLVLPVYDMFMPRFAKALGHEEWTSDERFKDMAAIENGGRAEFYHTVSAEFAKHTAAEMSDILTQADLPYAVAKVWSEVLEDEQAWATDCFLNKDYPSGKRIMVRNPVHFAEEELPPYESAPQLGENTAETFRALGYSNDDIARLLEKRSIRCA